MEGLTNVEGFFLVYHDDYGYGRVGHAKLSTGQQVC
jgi:hypothetical protein